MGRILANISIVKVTTYQNARTNESGVEIDGTVFPTDPNTFRNLPAVPVQEHPLGAMPWSHNPIGREGDLIVSRCDAGEDAGFEVEVSIAATGLVSVVVVDQEGIKSHSLGRGDGPFSPGRDQNNWPGESIGEVVGGNLFFLLHSHFGS